MANAFLNYNQSVFLNNQKLQGVTSVDASYTVTHKQVNVIGKGVINQVVAEAPQADFSITRDLTFVDLYQMYTGLNRSLNGSIHYNNRVFGFDEGYLTSYSYSVDYGQTPVSTLGITVYGDMGSGDANSVQVGSLNASGALAEYITKIPRPSDISLSCFGSTTNRIKNFSVDVDVPRHAIYAINNINPVEVHFAYPLKVSTSFTMEVDDFQSRRISDYLTTSTQGFDSFSINVKGIVYDPVELNGNGQRLALPDGTLLNLIGEDTYSVSQLWNYNSSNTKFIGQEISSSVDSPMQVKLNYETYLRNPSRDLVNSYRAS